MAHNENLSTNMNTGFNSDSELEKDLFVGNSEKDIATDYNDSSVVIDELILEFKDIIKED